MSTAHRRIALLTGAAPSAIARPTDPTPKFGLSFILDPVERFVSTMGDPDRLVVMVDDNGDLAS